VKRARAGSRPPPYRGAAAAAGSVPDRRSGTAVPRGWSGPANSIADAEAFDDPGDAVLEVYDTPDEFAEHVPPKFAKLVADAAAPLEIEELDA